MNFLDILLEAKGDKKPPSKKIVIDTTKNKDATDYGTDDETDAPADDTPPAGDKGGGDDTSTDYTQDDATDENNDDATDDTPSDYTQDNVELDPNNPDTTGDTTNDTAADGGNAGDGADTNTDDNTDEPTDYANGEGDGSGDDGTGDGDSTEENQEDPEADAEKNENRRLLEDFINFYYLNKGTIIKLSTVNRADLLINKIINRVKSNLIELQKQLTDFIIYRFSNGKFAGNLYSYNFFLEAFRINVQMLKKISDLSSNE